jgi:DNA topoisomerase-1
MKGKYGPYVKWGKVNATISKEIEPENVTMEMALQLISEKAPTKKRARKSPAKKAPKKSSAKPKTTKKA